MSRIVKLAVLAALVFAPSSAFAQGSISGVVRDTSNAVLPGVAIEVSSPVMIEGARTAFTDGAGQYRIVDLRPGTYAVTFTLSGFGALRREGIEVTGTFTATVNAALSVGSVAETVTVTGASPIVDVQSVARQRVISQEVIDAIPAARAYYAYGALIPGIVSNAQDVGGSLGNQQANSLRIHGSRQEDQRMTIGANGVSLNTVVVSGWGIGGGINMGAVEEVTVDLAAASADLPTGGTRVNFIPKEGGNTFAGNIFGSFNNGSMQGSNFTQALKDRGLQTPGSIKTNWDFNPSFGGPVRRNKMWFFFSSRTNRADNYVADMFENLNANNPDKWIYEPDLARPAANEHIWTDNQLRLTWQANQKNKIALQYMHNTHCRCKATITATRAPEADINHRYPIQYQTMAEWTSPMTNRLLLQVSALQRGQRYNNEQVDGLSPLMIHTVEQSTGLQYRANSEYRNSWTENLFYRATLSYVTGSHALKIGFNDGNGVTDVWNYDNQPVSYRLNNTIPNLITMRAFPYRIVTDMDHDLGLYVQDRWTLNRMTLTLGARYDYYSNSFPEQHLGNGPFTPTRDITFPAAENAAWHDITPKTGVVYDLFGTGKTALKVSLNKYLAGQGIGGLTLNPNPMLTVVSQTTRTWNDSFYPVGDPRRGNYVPDCDLMNTGLNAECAAMVNSNFGKPVPGAVYDSELIRGWSRREFNWEFSAGIQQEILPRVSTEVTYFRRWYGNFTVTDDLTLAAADFDRFSIPAPQDSRLPGGGGYVIGDLYNLNPTKFGQPANLFVTRASNYGEQTDRWHGMDVTVNARPRSGLLIQGGLSTGRAAVNSCAIRTQLPEATVTNPYCDTRENFLTQVKALASYTFNKIDVVVSGAFQSIPGPEIAAIYNAPNAVIAPSLGRSLSGNAVNVPVNLVVPGTMYGERLNQVDLRATKLFRFGRYRTRANFDVYNASNNDTVLGQNNNFAVWQRPTSILTARVFKLSAQFEF